MVDTTTAVAARDSHRASFRGTNCLKMPAERCMQAKVAAAAKHICTTHMHTLTYMSSVSARNTCSHCLLFLQGIVADMAGINPNHGFAFERKENFQLVYDVSLP